MWLTYLLSRFELIRNCVKSKACLQLGQALERDQIWWLSWKELVLQIEVESETLEKTIRKLSLGIIDQLCWLRNHDDSILQCSGFCFINHHGLGHVIQVDIQWSDHFKFFINTQTLAMKMWPMQLVWYSKINLSNAKDWWQWRIIILHFLSLNLSLHTILERMLDSITLGNQ